MNIKIKKVSIICNIDVSKEFDKLIDNINGGIKIMNENSKCISNDIGAAKRHILKLEDDFEKIRQQQQEISNKL